MRPGQFRGDRQADAAAGSLRGALDALLRARPALLSVEDLLQQAWDEHADPFTNTVYVTISRLRRKLGDPPAIETQPDAGYHIS